MLTQFTPVTVSTSSRSDVIPDMGYLRVGVVQANLPTDLLNMNDVSHVSI